MAWSDARSPRRPRAAWSRLRWMAYAAAFALAACSNGEDAPPVTFDAGDSGGGMDAGDGGGADGSLDGGDGGLGEGGVGPGTCRFGPAGDRFELGSDSMRRQRPVSIAPVADGFLVAWAATTEGAENAFTRFIPSGGAPGARHDLTDDFSVVREPAVTLSEDGFLAAWIDNSEGNFELWARPLDASGATSGSAMRLTTNDRREEAPALVTRSPGALLAWIEAGTGADSSRKAWTRLVDASGAASGGANEVTADGDRPTRPTLARSVAGTAIAWTDSTGDSPHAWLQKLSSEGSPQGEAIQLDSEGNVAGNVDVTLTEEGGAAVFDVNVSGVRQEVRYRPLDGTGEPTGSERSLLEGSATATDSSVAAFAGGFAVAYRALSGEGVDGPTIRLAFLDSAGDVIETMDLAAAEPQGGPTRIDVSFDGNILVGWSDRGADATTVRAARVRCSGTLPGDGGMDGGVVDGGRDASMDAFVPPPVDGGRFDGAMCLADGSLDPCACGTVPNDCSSTACPDDRTRCVDDGCGGRRCVLNGHRCTTAADCSSSSACVSTPGGRICRPTSGSGCNDSRDCPLGFACESGSCVDHRIPCEPDDSNCPLGFVCYEELLRGHAFCARAQPPCASDAACLAGGSCRDVDGDGSGECAFAGTCATNGDCTAAGEVCGSLPEIFAMCGNHGPCDSSSDCASGWECRDLWGNGARECVPSGGSCSSVADCPEHAVCASPSAGQPPECVARSF